MKGFIFCLATFSTVLVIDLDFLTMITFSFFSLAEQEYAFPPMAYLRSVEPLASDPALDHMSVLSFTSHLNP